MIKQYPMEHYVSASPNHCHCLDNLRFAIQKTETNYAGFPAKVQGSSLVAYRWLVQQLMHEAKLSQEALFCFKLLKRYIAFFKDKHFQLFWAQPPFWYYSLRREKTNFHQWLPLDTLTTLEGIWRNADHTLYIAIREGNVKGNYQATVHKSDQPDTVVGTLYYKICSQGTHYTFQTCEGQTNMPIHGRQVGNLLYVGSSVCWLRIAPFQPHAYELQEQASWRNQAGGLLLKRIAPDTVYLRIPSFVNNEAQIGTWVQNHDHLLKTTPYWVIDLRNNGGGEAGWIHLIPYLYTNPIHQGSGWLRISKENIAWKIRSIQRQLSTPFPTHLWPLIPSNYLQLQQKIIRDLRTCQDEFYKLPDMVLTLDQVQIYPKKVGVLVNELSASASEYFLYLCRQSQKTLSFGTHTLGMMDYMGMAEPTVLPYSKFSMYIPVVQSPWTRTVPIDLTGMTPDILISSQTQHWVDEVVHHLKKT